MEKVKVKLGIFIITALLSGPAAQAAFCPPFSSLGIRMVVCEDNFYLGKKADACLLLYTKELQVKKAQVVEKLKTEAEKGKQAQNAAYTKAGKALDLAQKELEQLILQGLQAKLAVDSYLSNIHFPEDYDNPTLTGMSSEKYLASEPCYATPRQVMSEDSEMLGMMVQDLKNIQTEVLAKQKTAQGQAQDMGSEEQTILKTTPTTGSPQEEKARKPIKQSDISKTPEEKK